MRAIKLDNNDIKFKEPFNGLFTQGMVCHETYKDKNGNWVNPDEVFSDNGKDFFLKKNPNEKIKVGPSESMSKSKKNTIDPENIISQFGADAVRFFILADSPPEKDIQWSDSGITSSYKFIQKFWLLNEQILEVCNKNKIQKNNELETFTNQIIFKINQAIEKFRYNVIIASYHEIYSFLKKIIESNENFENLKSNYEKIILTMLPVIPHIANECLKKLNYSDKPEWPNVDEKFLNNETLEIVIQINGKKRNLITIEKSMKEEQITKKIKEAKLIEKYLKSGELIKTIYVKDRLINFIIKQ